MVATNGFSVVPTAAHAASGQPVLQAVKLRVELRTVSRWVPSAVHKATWGWSHAEDSCYTHPDDTCDCFPRGSPITME